METTVQDRKRHTETETGKQRNRHRRKQKLVFKADTTSRLQADIFT